MSVNSEIERIRGNIAASYTAAEEKGAMMPTEQDSDNLAATIASIKTGGAVESVNGQTGEVVTIQVGTTELTDKVSPLADKVIYCLIEE